MKSEKKLMGYMGFGMRKETYTRRPKKVFERWKQTGKTPAFSTEFRSRPGNRIQEKSLRIYFILFGLTCLAALLVLIWKYVFSLE